MKPVGMLGDSGAKPEAGTTIADGPTFEAQPDRALPSINPQAKRIIPGRARLVGTHGSACSNQVPASGDGDRWCAFSISGTELGTTELWAINLTKALVMDVACDGMNANCRRLTTKLWTGQPDGGPRHPTSHRFDGDTLIFHAEAPTGLTSYRGPIFAWRPGWTEAKRIASDALTCSGHGRAEVAQCIQKISPQEVTPLQFELSAGRLANAPLPTVAVIIPFRANDASQWRATFTRDGESFAYSSGGKTVTERETLFVMKTADIPEIAANKDSPKKTKINMGEEIVSRWQISADSQKIYFLQGYNYSPDNPAGTLTMVDFPSGQNRVTLRERVGAYQLLLDGSDVDRGVGFYDDIAVGQGTFRTIRDRSKPTEVVQVITKVSSVLVSRDLRYAYFNREFDPDIGTTDAYVAKMDGSGSCALTTGVQSDLFGFPFMSDGNLVLWADKYDPATTFAEGWYATADGTSAACPNKKRFSDDVDFWFTVGNEGIIYSDEGTVDSFSLQYVQVVGGNSFGSPVKVQEQIGRVYALLPNFEAALFTISRGVSGLDGIYAFAKFPFSGRPSRSDGGAGADKPAPDAATNIDVPPVVPDLAPAADTTASD